MEERADALAVSAKVPFRELAGYRNRLRAITQGRGECSLAFDHYGPLPGGGGNLDTVHPGAAIALRTA